LGWRYPPGGATALDALNSFAFVTKAPAAAPGPTPKIANPTNPLRPTAVGAFILPSVVGAAATDVSQSRTCDKSFECAME
jgi:hypothetical protein